MKIGHYCKKKSKTLDFVEFKIIAFLTTIENGCNIQDGVGYYFISQAICVFYTIPGVFYTISLV
jgi:hypothetical protein